jgi:hypothetical protein
MSLARLGEAAAPDSIGLDAEAAVWYADVPNHRCVRVREGRGAGNRQHWARLRLVCPRGRTGDRCSWWRPTGRTARQWSRAS